MKKLKIKEEYLDYGVICPLTRRYVILRFVEEELYNYYYNKGYSDYFEEVPVTIQGDSKKYFTFPKIKED